MILPQATAPRAGGGLRRYDHATRIFAVALASAVILGRIATSRCLGSILLSEASAGLDRRALRAAFLTLAIWTKVTTMPPSARGDQECKTDLSIGFTNARWSRRHGRRFSTRSQRSRDRRWASLLGAQGAELDRFQRVADVFAAYVEEGWFGKCSRRVCLMGREEPLLFRRA